MRCVSFNWGALNAFSIPEMSCVSHSLAVLPMASSFCTSACQGPGEDGGPADFLLRGLLPVGSCRNYKFCSIISKVSRGLQNDSGVFCEWTKMIRRILVSSGRVWLPDVWQPDLLQQLEIGSRLRQWKLALDETGTGDSHTRLTVIRRA